MNIATHHFQIPQTKSISLEKWIDMKSLSTEMKLVIKKGTEMRDIIVKCLSGHAPSTANTSLNHHNNHHRTTIMKQLDLKNKYKYTIKCIENYLPYMHQFVNTLELQRTKNPSLKLPSSKTNTFSWTSGLASDHEKSRSVMTSLTSSSHSKSKKMQSSNEKFECIMILYTYVYCMCNYVAQCNYLKNQSLATMTNTNPQQQQSQLTSKNQDYAASNGGGNGSGEQPRSNEYDEEMRECSVFLRKAYGVLQHIQQTYLCDADRLLDELNHHSSHSTNHQNSHHGSGGAHKTSNSDSIRIPELSLFSCESVQYYCLGIGQLIAIQAAIISEAYTSTALSRLCVQAVQLFDSARQCSDQAVKQARFSDNFRILATNYRLLYRALTLQYLARDENKKENSGVAVMLICIASRQLDEMNVFQQVHIKSAGIVLHDFDLLTSYVKEVQMETKRLEQRYERENRTVFRQAIPDTSILSVMIPEGVLIPQAIPFQLPKNKALL